MPSFISPGAPCRDDSLLIQFSQRHSLTADAESTTSTSHTADVPPMQTFRPETDESYVFMRIAIALDRQRRPAVVPHAVLRRRTDGAPKFSSKAQDFGYRTAGRPVASEQEPPSQARVLAAEMKSEAPGPM